MRLLHTQQWFGSAFSWKIPTDTSSSDAEREVYVKAVSLLYFYFVQAFTVSVK